MNVDKIAYLSFNEFMALCPDFVYKPAKACIYEGNQIYNNKLCKGAAFIEIHTLKRGVVGIDIVRIDELKVEMTLLLSK